METKGDPTVAATVRSNRIDRVLRPLQPVLRWRYGILIVAAFGFCLQHMRGTGLDWHYFVEGSELIFGQHRAARPFPGGLHFYANYPDFQIGPLSLIAAAPIRILGGDHSRELGVLLMTAIGPLLIFFLERTATLIRPAHDERDQLLRHVTVLFGGLLVVEAWATLAAVYSHLDDVLTIALLIAAVAAVARARPVWVGLALGAAVAAKPWGLVALPLAFAFRGTDRWRAVSAAAATMLLAWGPFVIAAPDTLHAVQPQVSVVRGSVLHLLGVREMEAEAWTRWLQLFVSLLVGLIAVQRKQWTAVLLVGIAVRVALDPEIYLYYGAGLVVAAFAWDLLRGSRAVPLATLFAFVFLDDAYTVIHDPTVRAAMRLVVTVALVAFVLVPNRGTRIGDDGPQSVVTAAT